MNVVFVVVSQLLQSSDFGSFCAYELSTYIASLRVWGASWYIRRGRVEWIGS
jgi:hypothetical protein